MTAAPDTLDLWPAAALRLDRSAQVAAVNDYARSAGIELGMSLDAALERLHGLRLQWSRTTEPAHAPGWVVAVDTSAGRDRDGDFAKRLAESNLQLQGEVRRRRSLERQLLAVAEAEQRRISLELHDGLGQHLTGVAFAARALADALKADGHPRTADAEWMVRLLNETIGKTRALARGMWPVSLERDSLVASLRKLAEDLEVIFGVSCAVQVQEVPLPPSNVAAHHLFRVLQEAATNAIKHGQARRLTFRLERCGDELTASVINDGLPISAEALASSDGMGVVGMRLRADALGGRLDLSADTAAGCRVALTVPGFVARRLRVDDDGSADGDGADDDDALSDRPHVG